MRKPVIAGNLKMNLNRVGLVALLEGVKRGVGTAPPCEVVYCPPFTLLTQAADVLAGSPVGLGAQEMHWESSGAFTGEVSAPMLREAGCRWVILGHSERRTLFGETDARVRRKAAAALEAGLTPIVCVGETEEERKAGATEVVLSRQVVGSLGGTALASPASLVVAYEPVWAIGTGNTASPEQAQDAHAHLRRELGRVLGAEIASGIRILYGGSVKPDNARTLMERPDIDGALVGGACLKAETFLPIVEAAAPPPASSRG
jgi:triosephosphate isomerase